MFLKDAGIDTSIFSTHSIRGASATAAMEKGVTLSNILHIADWSSDTTFRRFYYRPVKDATYAHRVLSIRSDLVCGIVFKGSVPKSMKGTLYPGSCWLYICLTYSLLSFELYQCHMQRISRSIIANLTRALRARS